MSPGARTRPDESHATWPPSTTSGPAAAACEKPTPGPSCDGLNSSISGMADSVRPAPEATYHSSGLDLAAMSVRWQCFDIQEGRSGEAHLCASREAHLGNEGSWADLGDLGGRHRRSPGRGGSRGGGPDLCSPLDLALDALSGAASEAHPGAGRRPLRAGPSALGARRLPG